MYYDRKQKSFIVTFIMVMNHLKKNSKKMVMCLEQNLLEMGSMVINIPYINT